MAEKSRPPDRLHEPTRFFAAVAGLKHRAVLMTAYAAGLRVSEKVYEKPGRPYNSA
jgi:hypothetical protein